MVGYVEMPSQHWKYSPSIRIICIILAILCLVAEGQVLFSMRKYFPHGFAPASPISKPTGIYSAPIDQTYFFPDIERFEAIRDWILNDIGDVQDLQADALIPELRNWTRLQASNRSLEINNRDPSVVIELMHDGKGASCKPFADLFIAALNSFEVQARRVGLYTAPGINVPSHSTVEVWAGDRWVIQDPTFNAVAIGTEGFALNSWEIRDHYCEGLDVTWVQDRDETAPNMETYRDSPDTLYNILIYHNDEYPLDKSRLEILAIKLLERFSGKIQSEYSAPDGFPLAGFVTSGIIDRVLLALAVIFIIGAIFVRPRIT